VFTDFLDRLTRQTGRKVHVIPDRHPVHRSKTVRGRLADNTDRIELHLMPGCSPELNPDEIPSADLKHQVHAERATSADDLAREIRRFLHRRQRQPDRTQSYFDARHVRYTLKWATKPFGFNSLSATSLKGSIQERLTLAFFLPM
jgi:hypothetical protein